MELFARGEVEVLTPHDKLAFDKKRQLPAPPPPVPLEVKKSPPKSRVPRPPAPKSRVQEWLDNGGAEHFLAGFLNEPPPTKTGEAVPVDDDEIVEGEMLDSPVVTKDEEDVVDAEIVEESCPEE